MRKYGCQCFKLFGENRCLTELRGLREVGFELEELAEKKLFLDFFLYNIIIRVFQKIEVKGN